MNKVMTFTEDEHLDNAIRDVDFINLSETEHMTFITSEIISPINNYPSNEVTAK